MSIAGKVILITGAARGLASWNTRGASGRPGARIVGGDVLDCAIPRCGDREVSTSPTWHRSRQWLRGGA